ncbi:MAG: hypothetical protein D3904_13055 [Candidatus Electrothrix sp. EH2]|nr:hypothetical protein [Candidatus Electrothrix sp. EH2]
MSNLAWLIFIFLMVVLVISAFWFIWRLRHFSQSNNQTVLDDKLMQSMLGDENLSKELKNALVGKTSQAGDSAESSAETTKEKQDVSDAK